MIKEKYVRCDISSTPRGGGCLSLKVPTNVGNTSKCYTAGSVAGGLSSTSSLPSPYTTPYHPPTPFTIPLPPLPSPNPLTTPLPPNHPPYHPYHPLPPYHPPTPLPSPYPLFTSSRCKPVKGKGRGFLVNRQKRDKLKDLIFRELHVPLQPTGLGSESAPMEEIIFVVSISGY